MLTAYWSNEYSVCIHPTLYILAFTICCTTLIDLWFEIHEEFVELVGFLIIYTFPLEINPSNTTKPGFWLIDWFPTWLRLTSCWAGISRSRLQKRKNGRKCYWIQHSVLGKGCMCYLGYTTVKTNGSTKRLMATYEGPIPDKRLCEANIITTSDNRNATRV